MKWEVVMTVRKTIDHWDADIDRYVEQVLQDSPEDFVGSVSRADCDWEWYRVD